MSERIKWVLVFILAAILIISIMALGQPEVEVQGYEMHTVQEGETIWGIVREANPDCELTGELVKILRKRNGKDDAVIAPGEVLEVPITK